MTVYGRPGGVWYFLGNEWPCLTTRQTEGIPMKRTFGIVEAVFDVAYLIAGAVIGILLVATAGPSHPRLLAGIMCLVLAGGDSFHLVPRVRSIVGGDAEALRCALGRGKQVTSITMTLFYLLLWQIGCELVPLANEVTWTVVLLVLACMRVVLCLMPQNEWTAEKPPVSWGIIRNVPFAAMGVIVAVRYFVTGAAIPSMSLAGVAIIVSFACYLPVVIWSERYPQVGALMLPKTCAYVWLMAMCLGI
jgi:hypothetical protein